MVLTTSYLFPLAIGVYVQWTQCALLLGAPYKAATRWRHVFGDWKVAPFGYMSAWATIM